MDSLAIAADVRLHNVENSTLQGMRMTLMLDRTEDVLHFHAITHSHEDHAGQRFLMALMGNDEVAPLMWSGEVMLQGWSASHSGGARVRFLLNDEDDFRFLQDVPRETPFAMGLREIADDEAVVDAGQKEKVEANRGGALSQYAAHLCRTPEFLAYLADITQGSPTEAWAADFIRSQCGIQSRADLDHNPEAAEAFHETIRKPYAKWLDQHPSKNTGSGSLDLGAA